MGVVARAEDWRLVEIGEGRVVLIGRLFGRPRVPDGTWAVTSWVLALVDDVVRTHSGTKYELGRPWPAEEPLPGAAEDAVLSKLGAAIGTVHVDHLERIVEIAKRACLPEAAAGPELLAKLAGAEGARNASG